MRCIRLADDSEILYDHNEQAIRLTHERWQHILKHPEMVEQYNKVVETLSTSDIVVATLKDESVQTYQRLYESTPVTRKYMTVAVKILENDAFI